MRLFLGAIVLTVVATTASALPIVNGGFETGDLSGWTTWAAPWSVGHTVMPNTVQQRTGTTCARLRINNGEGSFGIYQVVDVPTDQPVTLECWVRVAQEPSANWAEALFFNYAVTNPNDIDSGAISTPHLAWKRDAWGGVGGVPGGTLPSVATPPDSNSWEKVTKTLASVPSGKVTVAFKWGRSGGGYTGAMFVDDVTVTPEPAALALLGLPILLVRRRR